MEHETVGVEVARAKRVLTSFAAIGTTSGILAALLRFLDAAALHGLLDPAMGLLGAVMILGFLVAAFALSTLLGVEADEAEIQGALDGR